MRRISSALTTTILGAALAASTVSAQQFLPSGGVRRDSSAASASATEAAPSPGSGSRSDKADPIFGMAASRGARYLLRNGLDYIDYQEYERALKYLREAENRQKELGDSEKLALKQGIERAQRGLREAVGADSPYALSRRSRRSGGFTAARSETQVAAAKPRDSKPARGPEINRESDEEGEPIRLAGAEVTSDPASRPRPAMLPRTPEELPVQQAPPSELPKLPQVPQMANLAPHGGPPTAPVAGQAPVFGRVDRPAPTAPATAEAIEPREAADSTPTPVATAPEGTASESRHTDARADAAAAAQADLLSPLPQMLSTDGTAARPKGQEVEQAIASGEPMPARRATSTVDADVAPSVSAAAAPAAPERPGLPPTEPPKADSPMPANEAPASPESRPVKPTPGPTQASDAELPLTTPASITLEQPAEPATRPAPLVEPRAVDLDRFDLPPLSSVRDQPKAVPASISTADAQPAPAAPDAVNAEARQSQAPPVQSSEPSGPPLEGDLPPLPGGTLADPAQKPVEIGGKVPAVASSADELPPLPDGRSTREASQGAKGEALPPAAEELPLLPTDGGTANPVPAVVSPSASVEREQSQPATAAMTGATGPAGDTPVAVSVPAESPAGLAAPADRPVPLSPTGSARRFPAAEPSGSALSSEPKWTKGRTIGARSSLFELPVRENPPSSLRPDLQRAVEEIARRQEDELRRNQAQQPEAAGRDALSDLKSQSAQVDISRAPSPAEARPIRAIPVPDDWVPLAKRDWSPQSKYWAAAATCHMPLYFQDPMLERYGHPVEAFFGPTANYLAYPVDDPKQSTQRNQVVQPFFSTGLFAFQILALPYNLIMDPPWESQYDLGYYRPGDRIPTDTYYWPWHGIGPPLRGRKY